MTKFSVVVCTLSAFASGILASAAPASFTGVQPQLAALGARVYVAFGHEDSISVARSDDRGGTFNAPVRLPLSGRLSLVEFPEFRGQ
jgi:hypothetical protein